MTLFAARQEPSEEDDCDDVRIIASSDPSSIGEMVFGIFSCGDFVLCRSFVGVSRLVPIGAGTDVRAVSVVPWGADGGELVTSSEAEHPAVCGDVIDMLGAPLTDSSGTGALSATDCVVSSTFFTEGAG